ncbi:hypothetical protein TELCIR_18590, partial [Teladorsagia circumcincta]
MHRLSPHSMLIKFFNSSVNVESQTFGTVARDYKNDQKRLKGPIAQISLDREGTWGRVEDTYLLDNITMAIREGIIGANGFRADYAVIVTWERMAYGGAPKVTQVNRYEEAKRWTNTYQVVLATDEIRSYVMFNYAHINWTSSNTAGALQGRGGLQSAM